ncbi:MAG: PaaI family thioesterase [Desulfobulbaceae bacterium]|nr:MAG: PaaI family thioesterase [Desulfobulbaceae bacterium]
MHQPLEILKARLEKDTYAQSLGISLDSITDQTIEMHMQLKKSMNNWFSRPHGGAIYALADVAFSLLANKSQTIAVALECSITYHHSPDPGDTLVVKGECLAESTKTGSYLFKIFARKETGSLLIATMKSVAYRTEKPLNT